MPMYRTFSAVAMSAAVVALVAAVACSSSTPAGPSSAGSTTRLSNNGAAPDGSTLKASAPTLQSPINNEAVSLKPTLEISGSTGRYVAQAFSYEFEVQTDSGAVVKRATPGGTTWEYPENLQPSTFYKWRARATLNGAVGPWAGFGRFITSQALTAPAPTASAEEWRVYFFGLIDQKGVGSNFTFGGLAALRPDLNAVGVDVQHDSAGNLRPRIFLPNPGHDPFKNAVDVGENGQNRPWTWVVRF
jgi:hypothetical protein